MRTNHCTKDREKRASGYFRWIVTGISITIATTLSIGFVLLYIQHIRLTRTLHRDVVVLQEVFDPSRYFKGTVTFTEKHGGKVKEIVQDVYVDEGSKEQVLHFAGSQTEVFALQDFVKKRQMAVMLLANVTDRQDRIMMCEEQPLEGDYVSTIHYQHINGSNVGEEVTVTESFRPADRFMYFRYRTCRDIPRELFRNEHPLTNPEIADEEVTTAPKVKRAAALDYGGWCGPGQGPSAISCCRGCNANYDTCVSRSCRPVLDHVDKACFTYKMCEECSGHSTGIPSCSCIRDFMVDLKAARCNCLLKSLNTDPILLSHEKGVFRRGQVALGSHGVAAKQGLPNNGPVSAIVVGSKGIAATAKRPQGPVDNTVAAANNIDPLIAKTKLDLKLVLADVKQATVVEAKSRGKRNTAQLRQRFQKYDRKSCFVYRGRTMTELMNQRCWCPVFIRVKYICGYQQVPGSCTAKGKKCSVKYHICTKIMAGKKLNAVGYKNCPSVP